MLKHKALYSLNHVILERRGYCEFCWQTWGVESIFYIHQVFSPLWETLKIRKIWLPEWWLQWGEKPCTIVVFSKFFLCFLLNFYMVTDNGFEKRNAKFQVSLCVLLSVITRLIHTWTQQDKGHEHYVQLILVSLEQTILVPWQLWQWLSTWPEFLEAWLVLLKPVLTTIETYAFEYF